MRYVEMCLCRTAAASGSIVCPLGDTWVNTEHLWNDIAKKNQWAWRKPASVPFYSPQITWTSLAANPNLGGEKQVHKSTVLWQPIISFVSSCCWANYGTSELKCVQKLGYSTWPKQTSWDRLRGWQLQAVLENQCGPEKQFQILYYR